MLDGVSLDHLRIFVAAADAASFSAAGRKLGRAQSVISQQIAALEGQLGVSLFTRKGRFPQLTQEGRNLIGLAREICRDVDGLKAQARAMAEGLEPELSLVIDVMFPQAVLTDAVKAFAETFPHTALRLHVETLGAVPELVLNGRCRLGIMASFPEIPTSLESVRLLSTPMVTVAAAGSVLAATAQPISPDQLSGQVQLVLSDRSTLTEGQDFGVVGPSVWRLADLGAKHAFLRAGLGWGNMPLTMVAEDIANGTLKRIDVGFPSDMAIPMSAVYRTDAQPGPAGRWLIERLRGDGAGQTIGKAIE